MGSKSVVKVFKRKDLETTIHQMSEATNNEAKIERRSRRELVSTVSNWVTERRERSHVEEIESLRRIFGDSIPTLSRA